MADTQTLAKNIDSAMTAMEEKRKKFKAEETRKHQDWMNRLDQLGGLFDGLRDIWKPRLEVLIQKFGDKVTTKPSLAPSSRDIALDFQSEVARIRLRFQATTDHDIRKLILNYDLEIVPILMQFDSHAELEMPLDAIDRDAIAKWVDERILSFVKAYIDLHENQYYLKDQMVQDPVSGTRFPKFSAGAVLERDGRTYYFISEATRREFEKQGAQVNIEPGRKDMIDGGEIGSGDRHLKPQPDKGRSAINVRSFLLGRVSFYDFVAFHMTKG